MSFYNNIGLDKATYIEKVVNNLDHQFTGQLSRINMGKSSYMSISIYGFNFNIDHICNGYISIELPGKKTREILIDNYNEHINKLLNHILINCDYNSIYYWDVCVLFHGSYNLYKKTISMKVFPSKL